MVVDLAGFGVSMKLYAVKVSENIDIAVRKVALAIDQAVVTATPVDTGRARSNWLASVGSARQDTVDPHDPGTHGSTAAANTQASLDQAIAAVGSYKGGSAIYISNNLPYIQPLNRGWSKQAPAGFVEIAVVAGVNAVNSARVLP